MLSGGWSRCARVVRAVTRTGAAVVMALFLARPANGAGTMWVTNGPGGRVAIREHSVRVEVQDGIAVTEVLQVFQNLEDRVVEAMYRFALPQGASLADFTMWINGKEMVGEVVERRRARQIYDSYKPVVRDPGLVEKTDDGAFEMRIFPVNPKATQKVRLRYYEELPFRRGRYTYVYPLHVDMPRQWWPQHDANRAERFSLRLHVHSALGVASMRSESHPPLKIERRSDVYWRAGLESANQSLEQDVAVSWTTARRPGVLELYGSRGDEKTGTFRAVLTLGDDVRPDPADGQDYVFVLDVSGSMKDDARLERARELLTALLGRLGPGDRFTILAAGPTERRLFEMPAPADEAALAKAKEFLSTLRPGGSVIMEPILASALSLRQAGRPLAAVLISDGILDFDDPGPLGRRVGELVSAGRLVYVPLTCRVEGTLTDLVRQSLGWVEHLPPGRHGDEAAGAVAYRLARPAVVEPRLEWDGAEITDVTPANLRGLWPGETISVYGRYRGSGRVTMRLRGRLGGREFLREATAALPECDLSKGKIERMWATRRVEDLVELSRTQKEQAQQETLWRIVRLGELHSIATDYTSFLVLENDAEFRKWQIERTNALRTAWDREGDLETRQRLAALREGVEAMSDRQRRDGVRIEPRRDTAAPAWANTAGGEFKPELPRPLFSGTPRNIRAKNLRPPRVGPRRIVLPEGVRVKNVAFRKGVTSSDTEPIIGDLAQITDGDKEGIDGSYVELSPGRQWVQIDLGEEHVIRFILFWQYHREGRVYRDVIVQVSNDPDFVKGVVTLFNNDYDNSSGLGVGKDLQYVDSFEGELVMPPRPVIGRYVRLWSNGNTSNDMNHYTEVEVYASPPE